MLKCTQIGLAAGLRPDPLEELMRSPGPLNTMGPTSSGKGGGAYLQREGKGAYF